MASRITRQEAIEFLTGQRDLMDDARREKDAEAIFKILKEAGKMVGYAPAFRALVMDIAVEEAIRWL